VTDYAAPLADMRFQLSEIAGLAEIATLPACEQATPDLVDAVLEEAARLASGVLAPLNRIGDEEGSTLENGVVRTPAGFKEAYRHYVEGGWNALPFAPEHGGQGLPLALATAVLEMWNAANMGFALCPLLNVGAVEALTAHGSPEQQRLYLPKLITGAWTGTMNLTEPQAGSDVGALRSRAVAEGDHYRITGQKIFITYGEHDMAENIVHLVLARLPDAPPGTKGISLFLVPKFLVNGDGSLGQRNDVRCVSLEHKLGIHASPTAVLAYGDNGGAVGYLIGEENRGMECMFTMMNSARLNVGVQGVALAERAYQQARDFARLRVQGRPVTARSAGTYPIVHHPDVRRMLLLMRAETEAMRALAYYTAGGIDRARHSSDADTRAAQQRRVDLLIPVVKAWCTDLGVEIASLGVQVHGGMGFIEETGAAQHLRDARITPIYEGTNGIQANDLVGRKLLRDRGAAARALIREIEEGASALGAGPGDDLAAIRAALAAGIDALDQATRWMIDTGEHDTPRALAGAVPYLKLAGATIGGWLMGKAALAAQHRLARREGDAGFNEAKLLSARCFAEHVLATAPALLPGVMGGNTVMSFDIDWF
ncbi:MAG TPA: acyl-CoA dehydrogenase, partial [Methylocystis sp.]|nr:acyl-CoA dehydrogenase [Methylocystis sp.]